MDTFVQDLFTDQVTRSANSIALMYGAEQMTYEALDYRANQFANHLKMINVNPETLVGICVDRSLMMVIAILGLLKAGCAYVPLDPSYPQERLAFILDDANVEIVITESRFLGMFSETHVNTLCLDRDSEELQKQSGQQVDSPISPKSLAYVIYTSGSTGKPKGVMISHSSLASFVQIAGLALDVNHEDVYLQTASIAYALSVRQLLIPLVNGSTLVIASSAEMHDPLLLFELIRKRKITLMDVVPTFWRSCIKRLSDLPVEELKSLMDNSLRRIVSIGEPLLSDLPYEWMTRFGQKEKLVNIFGQTETTGVVATYTIPEEVPNRPDRVPIGQSIPDTRLYILDSNLEPVEGGEQGELCVSNPCLASGYLNHPELTAEKFIPNPFHDGFNERLYRTGDLARIRSDGNIEFLGRGDHQVKIRGQRLEIGEVEAVLREHALVKECVVVAHGDAPDEKYLTAYVIPVSHKTIRVSELKDFVRTRLPDYMIPTVIVFLEAFPLTPNGKLDRLALPDAMAMQRGQDFTLNTFVKPYNHIEQTIALIWRDLLKLERVGIQEDYFDLGGHSLMAVQMFARIERDLGVRLPYTTLFHSTTIAQIAQVVMDANEEVTQWSIVVPIQTCGNKPPFFGVHGHEGGVLFWRDLVAQLPKDQPFYGLQAQGVDGIQHPLTKIPDMAALYIREMRKIQPSGPYYLGGYSLGGEIAFEMAQQLQASGEQVLLLVMFDTRNPQRPIRPMVRIDEGSMAPTLGCLNPSGRYGGLKQKIKGHYLRWSVLNSRNKYGYIFNQITARIKHFGTNVLVKIIRAFGLRLPDFLLLRYLRESHSEALINYVPAIYPGKVTLFRALETLPANPDESPTGWKPLTAGGLEVYHFDASHEILDPKYVKDVASRLNECLQKARKTSSLEHANRGERNTTLLMCND